MIAVKAKVVDGIYNRWGNTVYPGNRDGTKRKEEIIVYSNNYYIETNNTYPVNIISICLKNSHYLP